MFTEDGHHRLKQSLVALSESFVKIITIDFLIAIKKSIGVLVACGLTLIFGLTLWLLLNFALAEYMLAQYMNRITIYSVLILLNTVGILICNYLGRRRLNNIQFDYTARALNKIKEACGEHNERS